MLSRILVSMPSDRVAVLRREGMRARPVPLELRAAWHSGTVADGGEMHGYAQSMERAEVVAARPSAPDAPSKIAIVLTVSPLAFAARSTTPVDIL